MINPVNILNLPNVFRNILGNVNIAIFIERSEKINLLNYIIFIIHALIRKILKRKKKSITCFIFMYVLHNEKYILYFQFDL